MAMLRALGTAVAVVVLGAGLAAMAGGPGSGDIPPFGEPPSGPPKVLAVYPADGVTLAMGSEVIIGFDRSMDQGTITSDSVLIDDLPLEKAQPDARLIFPDPTGRGLLVQFPLLKGGVYKMTLTTAISDEQGQQLPEPFVWHFATRLRASSLEEPPRLVAHYPRDGQVDVPTDAPIVMQWSFDMNDTSFTEEHLAITPAGSQDTVSYVVSVMADRVICVPKQPLQPNTRYQVRPSTMLRSAAGVGADHPAAWTFTTGTGPAREPFITTVWSNAVVGGTQRHIVLAAGVQSPAGPIDKMFVRIEGWPEPIELRDSGDYFNDADMAADDQVYSRRVPIPAGINGGKYQIRWGGQSSTDSRTEPVVTTLEIPGPSSQPATTSAPASQPL